MNTISIALFSHRPDAEPLQRRLNEAGIQAAIHDFAPLNGARIAVPAEQFAQAHRLLLEWEPQGVLRGAIRCPECKSLRVEYPQYTHKATLPNLLIGFLVNIGAVNKEFYCHDCHFTWPKEGTKPSRARPHVAPYYFIEGVEQPQPSETRHAA